MKRKIAFLLAVLFIFMGVTVSATKMYAPDGRVASVHPDDVEAWKKVGWYDYPVMKVYSLDGREQIISKSAYSDWRAVGWYDTPSMVVYAPDGYSQVIPKSAFKEWKKVGWYEKPVMYVYASDGRKEIIYRKDYPAWNKVGWMDKSLDIIYFSTIKSLYYNDENFDREYSQYCYYDIDKDGTPELIYAGNCYEVYTYQNGYVKYIGRLGGDYGYLATVPNQNGVLFMWGRQGYENATVYKIVNGKLEETEVLSRQIAYYYDPTLQYSKPWEIIPGSTYINMKDVEDLIF